MNPTTIEWTEATWNPVTGCTPVSAGCANCYAKRMANRLRGRYGYPADEPFRVTLHHDRLDEPLHLRKARMMFVCSMSDLFHKNVPNGFIDKVFGIMCACPQHTFQVLTKRAERMQKCLGWSGVLDGHPIHGAENLVWPLPNAWLGVTVENQEAADERIPHLLQTPAAVRFVSLEPLLGPVDLRKHVGGPEDEPLENIVKTVEGFGADGGEPVWACVRCGCEWEDGHECPPGFGPRLDWVIVGGESGPGARPMKPEWARDVRDQCKAAGVPFFLKQMSKREPIPKDLLIRKYPV